MSKTSRRRFLKQSVAALSAVGLPAYSKARGQVEGGKRPLAPEVLRSMAEVVLPSSELKAEGIARVVSEFESWLDGFEPVAELDHPYGSPEILYGPPDPWPRWQSQLEALELEAQKKHGTSFQKLAGSEKRRLVERQLRAERLERLPDPAEAHHVAVGLLAYFYSTPEANDLCYEATIGRWNCRGLDSGPAKPARLSKRG